jgi:hypothetical protein
MFYATTLYVIGKSRTRSLETIPTSSKPRQIINHENCFNKQSEKNASKKIHTGTECGKPLKRSAY